jgi:hypothetical protein
MRYTFSILFLVGLVGCSDKTCSYEFPTECHTEVEWKKISDDNWKGVECMNKQLRSSKCNSLDGDCFYAAEKKCRLRTKVEFKNAK